MKLMYSQFVKRSLLSFTAILVLCSVSGCLCLASPPENIETKSVSTATLPSVASATAAPVVKVPTDVVTLTVRPTSIFTPKPSLTRTPFPTNTPTPSHEEVRLFVEEMLETNGGCELPCWWGVVPGEMNLTEAQEQFSRSGFSLSHDGKLSLCLEMNEERGWCEKSLEVQYLGESKQIQKVIVRYSDDHSSPQALADMWRRYTLDQVLTRYGLPSQVYLDVTVGQGCRGPGYFVPTYDMWVVYDHLGIAVRYSGIAIWDLGAWRLCPMPAGQVDWWSGPREPIEIRLQSPSWEVEPLVSIESERDSIFVKGSLAELTDMDVRQFYEIFSQPDYQTCLSVTDLTPYPDYDEIISPSATSLASVEEEEGFLLDMLATNGGCELPCWWGITPGVTPFQDAQHFFLSRGRAIGHFDQEYLGDGYDIGLFGRFDPYAFDYLVQHTLYEESGIVNYIRVTGETPGYTPGQHFSEDWQRYSPSQMMTRFGIPSRVYLIYQWAGCADHYRLEIVYDDLGILAKYGGYSTIKGNKRIICPRHEDLHLIDMSFISPSVYVPLGNTSDQFASEHISLDEATGMDIETFYNEYLDSNGQMCIEALQQLGEGCP